MIIEQVFDSSMGSGAGQRCRAAVSDRVRDSRWR